MKRNSELDGYAAQLYLEDTMRQAKSWFGDIVEIARQKDVSNNNGDHIEVITDIFTSVKSIVETIVNYATDKNIDLVVIGTRGRSGIKRVLLGSIAKGVVQHANCPILLVR